VPKKLAIGREKRKAIFDKELLKLKCVKPQGEPLYIVAICNTNLIFVIAECHNFIPDVSRRCEEKLPDEK